MIDNIIKEECQIYSSFFNAMNYKTSLDQISAKQVDLEYLSTKYKSFLFDGFGTLYTQNTVHPGAKESLDFLRKKDCNIRLLTNSASMSELQMKEFMANLGLHFELSEIISSGSLLKGINQELKIKQAMYLGRKNGEYYLKQSNIEITNRPNQAIVILSSMLDATEQQRKRALEILKQKDALLIVLNPDVCTPVVGKNQRVFASGYAAWQLHLESQCKIIFGGKPFTSIFNKALDSLGNYRDPVLMVGDTLGTDIAGSRAAGIDSALLFSGNSTINNISDLESLLEVRPNYYLNKLKIS